MNPHASVYPVYVAVTLRYFGRYSLRINTQKTHYSGAITWFRHVCVKYAVQRAGTFHRGKWCACSFLPSITLDDKNQKKCFLKKVIKNRLF